MRKIWEALGTQGTFVVASRRWQYDSYGEPYDSYYETLQRQDGESARVRLGEILDMSEDDWVAPLRLPQY